MREKSYVEDIDRSIYDFKDDEKDAYKVKAGLTPEIVQKISDEKKDPAWISCSVCVLYRSTTRCRFRIGVRRLRV